MALYKLVPALLWFRRAYLLGIMFMAAMVAGCVGGGDPSTLPDDAAMGPVFATGPASASSREPSAEPPGVEPACDRDGDQPTHCPGEQVVPLGGPPDSIRLNTSWYMGGGVAVDWDRLAAILPDGFAPAGFPDLLVNGQQWGTPEGTYANLLLILTSYEDAWIDDVHLPAGRIAMALTIVEPSQDHQVGLTRNWMILAATATDEALADALGAWGFDVTVGDVEMAYESLGPDSAVVVSKGSVASETLSASVEVHGQGVALGYFGGSAPQQIANWGVRDGQAGPALIYHLPGHNQRPGPATLEGRFGAFGDLDSAAGYGSAATWFGSVGGSPGDNEAGELVYQKLGSDLDNKFT